MTNYFDKQGNYINCENLSLAEIYHRAFALGVESVAIDKRPQVDAIPQECIKELAEAITDVVKQIDWKALCEKVEERSKGEWTNTSSYDDKGECSSCCYLSKKYYKFCPNCGAKMKGGENGMMGNIQNDRDCEHCAHYVKAGLDWYCCESWECEFKPKGDEKND